MAEIIQMTRCFVELRLDLDLALDFAIAMTCLAVADPSLAAGVAPSS